jgi:putative intracellular protease/amidase
MIFIYMTNPPKLLNQPHQRKGNIMSPKALILTTSAGQMGAGGKATGFYWEELAAPYFALIEAGLAVDFANILGGMPPADPGSAKAEGRSPAVQRFMDDPAAMAGLKASRTVASLKAEDYVVIYLPGGHGTMWDLAQTPGVGALVAQAFDRGAVVAAVCHGVAGLVNATLASGDPLVKGRRVNSFTDAEEHAAGLATTVPYLLETALREKGALFEGNINNFQSHAAQDGRLITGQNPRSTVAVTKLMMQAVHEAVAGPVA